MDHGGCITDLASDRTGGRTGHPRTYTDTAIATMATMQEIYHLGLRQTEGLLQSIGELLHLWKWPFPITRR